MKCILTGILITETVIITKIHIGIISRLNKLIRSLICNIIINSQTIRFRIRQDLLSNKVFYLLALHLPRQYKKLIISSLNIQLGTLIRIKILIQNCLSLSIKKRISNVSNKQIVTPTLIGKVFLKRSHTKFGSLTSLRKIIRTRLRRRVTPISSTNILPNLRT